jgi:DNA invertase Pin-like site-specific DNA recombinase
MTALMPWERTGSKVTDRQLARLAVVYVRQSSMQQVADHQESTRLQYALVDRAAALGWPASRVVVIDEDLGRSGASTVGRSGFQRLVTEIGLDHVGLVLGIEMSRLARSGKDWYQLIELCALSGALLADTDGVYDPAEHNDRLLLGLKGTMAEAELHLIKQRMQAGRVNRRAAESWPCRCRSAMCAEHPARRSSTRTSRHRPWCGWSSRSSPSSALCTRCCAGWSSTGSNYRSGCAGAPTRASWSGGSRTG